MNMSAPATLILAGWLALAAPLRAAESARLVIVPFDNVTGRKTQDPLQEGIADLLTVCFAPFADRVAVVDRSVLRRLTDEQSLSQANLVANDTWQRVGQLSGATHLLGGNFGRSPKGLEVQGSLSDVGSTQLVFSVECSGGAAELAEMLCDRIAQGVVKHLDAADTVRSLPDLDVDPAYNHLMISGMGHYYNGNLAQAFPAFMKILRVHPKDEPAQFWLARSFYEAELMEFAAVEFKKYLDRHPQGKRRSDVEALLQRAEGRSNE